ncbi:MAG: DegV family protein [Clostridia bacterium]|nr:DegV family protein [Clostridia bacterium]
MNIKITSDSTCDLSKEILDDHSISVVPLNVILGVDSYSDGVDITPYDIFDYVERTGRLPKTSATSVTQYEDFFNKQLKSADYIVHISLSSKISSSYENALRAADAVARERIFVVDSLSLCAGQGLIAVKAARFAAQGNPPKSVALYAERIRKNVVTSFVPDSLEYLHMGGRCSLASMMSAKLLKLHPLIVMEDGVMSPKKKYMGNMEACLKKYISDAAAAFTDYDPSICILSNACADPALIDNVRNHLKAAFDFETVYETTAGSTITSHCGRNTMAIFFMRKDAAD